MWERIASHFYKMPQLCLKCLIEGNEESASIWGVAERAINTPNPPLQINGLRKWLINGSLGTRHQRGRKGAKGAFANGREANGS